MKLYKIAIGIILGWAAIVGIFLTFQSAQVVTASGQTIIPFTRFASATTSLLAANVSQLVDATNTARVYLQLSNLSTSAIYCSDRSPALLYQGITIYASSTFFIRTDEDPYNGPLYCVSPGGSASTTIIER